MSRRDERPARPFIIVIATVIATMAGIVASASQPTPQARTGRLPGVQTSPAPWRAEHAQLAERLEAMGLARLSEEGQALHTHQHLDVFVAGERVEVPPGIGIDAQRRFIAAIHTHDPSGVIHIESPTIQRFTLGQFFDVWGVRFDSRCLGGSCASGERQVRVYANGTPVEGDPRQLTLTPHAEIVVVYGTQADVPSPVPTTYKFPEGL